MNAGQRVTVKWTVAGKAGSSGGTILTDEQGGMVLVALDSVDPTNDPRQTVVRVATSACAVVSNAAPMPIPSR